MTFLAFMALLAVASAVCVLVAGAWPGVRARRHARKRKDYWL